MTKLNKETIGKFQSLLQDENESWKTEFNLHETVEHSFDAITKAKERGASWQQIALTLTNAIGTGEVLVNPNTVRQYYYEISREKASRRKSEVAQGLQRGAMN